MIVRLPSKISGPLPTVPPPPAAPSGRAPLDAFVVEGRAAPGPVDRSSPEASRALTASLDYLRSRVLAGQQASDAAGFALRTLERDELGMTHVRLDRFHRGLRVFPEQVITHLDPSGRVVRRTGSLRPIPAQLGLEAATLSEGDARAKAVDRFGARPSGEPAVERVITATAAGEYVLAYRVVCEDLSATSPRRENSLIDANTGAILETWNEIETISGEAGEHGAAASFTTTASGAASPNARIPDLQKVESKISLAGDFDVAQLVLNVDIEHHYSGDLQLTLIAPSGKAVVVVQSKVGRHDPNLKESFDLGPQFAGEPVAGEWTLRVEDKASGDSGVLKSWNLTAAPAEPSQPPAQDADDTTLYSGVVGIGATARPDGSFRLLDTTRGLGVETRDGLNEGMGGERKPIFDDDNVWGEATDNARNAAAVDAQYGAQMTYDFYRDVLGRNSIDGAGEMLISNVHIRESYVNAYWDGQQMNYGDGDGRYSAALTTLDLAGHEITHGLTERTAGLVYAGESGALSESWSDILGAGVEWYALQKNPALQGKINPYWVAEQCWTPGTAGDAVRYMDDPTKDGSSIDHYSNYPRQTEMHRSSGIANNAFYLLTHGGTNRTSGLEVRDGIGMEQGLKIFSRALIHYLTANAKFADARKACLDAATDLYGSDSPEVARVGEAWTAVGVA